MYCFGLVLLFALVDYGCAIVCYECNSALNTKCAAVVPPDSLKRNCSEHDRGVRHTLCRKIIQHVDYGINGQRPAPRVIRTCGWDETKYKGACYHRSGYGGHQEVCSCQTDLCNGTQSLAPYSVISLIIAITVYYVSNRQTHFCS